MEKVVLWDEFNTEQLMVQAVIVENGWLELLMWRGQIILTFGFYIVKPKE
ncbi:MAG TPA: hypothetical protein VM871_04185 [Flavisolibacter sp.]|nr:hypothetical protein [Flavisolibacter sp.]